MGGGCEGGKRHLGCINVGNFTRQATVRLPKRPVL
jgi:hypothetical protein